MASSRLVSWETAEHFPFRPKRTASRPLRQTGNRPRVSDSLTTILRHRHSHTNACHDFLDQIHHINLPHQRARIAARTANLFLMHLQRIAILHIELHHINQRITASHASKQSATHIVRSIWRIHHLPVEDKATALRPLTLPFTECIHELLELRRALDLEENFVVAVCNFDVDVARLLRLFCWSIGTWRI